MRHSFHKRDLLELGSFQEHYDHLKPVLKNKIQILRIGTKGNSKYATNEVVKEFCIKQCGTAARKVNDILEELN